jgi:hypothetical protein
MNLQVKLYFQGPDTLMFRFEEENSFLFGLSVTVPVVEKDRIKEHMKAYVQDAKDKLIKAIQVAELRE